MTGFLILFVFISPSPLLSSDSPRLDLLTGRVLDELGRGIPGVEVLVFEAGRESSRLFLRNSLTNSTGGFRIDEMNPGSYLLALSKPGYRILLTQVNTRIRSWLRVVLLPGPTGDIPGPSLEPPGMDWVLRAHRSDLLKEWRAKGPTATGWSPEPASGALAEGMGPTPVPAVLPTPDLPLDTEVEQWFTSAIPFQGNGGETATARGRMTSMDLSGDLGKRGRWELEGAMETRVTEPSQPRPAETDQATSALQVTMQYDLNGNDAISFRAGYDVQSLRDAVTPIDTSPVEQDARVWGYQADWSRKEEGGPALEMNLGYLESSAHASPEAVEPGGPPVGGSAVALQDRQWTLGAAYDFHVSPQHRVSVSARTRAYEAGAREEEWAPAVAWPAFGLARPGVGGWAVSISGEDSWQFSTPTRLVMGVDYHRVDRPGALSVLVPRVGARREGERSVVQGHLLVRVDDDPASQTGDPEDRQETWGGENPIGFRGEYQYRLGQSWTLGGHLARNPFDLDSGDPRWSPSIQPTQTRSLFHADPTATSRELGIMVQRQFRGMKGSLESEGGRISGRVSSRHEESPVLALNEGEIRYLALRAVASVKRTETEVRVDYRRMAESLSENPEDDPLRVSLLDLVVFQPLPFLERWSQAEWRVLFACQALERELFSSEQGEPQSQRVHRISGGVGVSF